MFVGGVIKISWVDYNTTISNNSKHTSYFFFIMVFGASFVFGLQSGLRIRVFSSDLKQFFKIRMDSNPV